MSHIQKAGSRVSRCHGEEGGRKSIQVPCPQGEEVGYPGPMTRGGIGYGGSGGIVDHHVISNGPWSDTCL